MPSGAVYLNEANGSSFSLDQRTVTFVGGIKELGAGENWAQLWVLDHLYDRRPDAVLNFRGNTTNSGERVLLTENGAFSLVHRYDWGDEIGFNWVVSNSNGRLPWTTSRMPDWDGNTAADRGHFWVGDYQTYTWKGGAGLWNDPAMWEPEGTKTHDQAGYPVAGSYFTFPAGESEVTIPATDKPFTRPVSFEVPTGASVTLKAAEGAQTFGLWRIAKKNGGFYYVPVYHFFSDGTNVDWKEYVEDDPRSGSADMLGISRSSTYRERYLKCLEKAENYYMLQAFCRTFGGEYWGGVTVNALDGTIIDKDKGY
jgi:hypothetical protein